MTLSWRGGDGRRYLPGTQHITVEPGLEPRASGVFSACPKASLAEGDFLSWMVTKPDPVFSLVIGARPRFLSVCYFQHRLRPFFPFCSVGRTLCGSLPASALLCGSRQRSFKCGFVCGTPTEIEVLVGKGQSGNRWGWEKCCGSRGDLLADVELSSGPAGSVPVQKALWIH